MLLIEFPYSLPPTDLLLSQREAQMSLHRHGTVAFSNFTVYHGHLPNIQLSLEAFEPRPSPEPSTAAVVPCFVRRIKLIWPKWPQKEVSDRRSS